MELGYKAKRGIMSKDGEGRQREGREREREVWE